MAMTIDLQVGESIRIGDDIVIVLEDKNGKRSRLGVVAPRSMKITLPARAANDNEIAVERNLSSSEANQLID